GRMIEKLRDCIADFVEPRPIQIAKSDALPRLLLRGFDARHLRCEISPGLAVENQTINPGPQLRVHRLGKIVLPPKIKRQIGIEKRETDARQKLSERTIRQRRD